MDIRTAHGWRQLSPATYTKPGHVPSLLEAMGITPEYDGVKGFADYANGHGRGYYFHYNADGSVTTIDRTEDVEAELV